MGVRPVSGRFSSFHSLGLHDEIFGFLLNAESTECDEAFDERDTVVAQDFDTAPEAGHDLLSYGQRAAQ